MSWKHISVAMQSYVLTSILQRNEKLNLATHLFLTLNLAFLLHAEPCYSILCILIPVFHALASLMSYSSVPKLHKSIIPSFRSCYLKPDLTGLAEASSAVSWRRTAFTLSIPRSGLTFHNLSLGVGCSRIMNTVS